jgi:hypothetical protein
MWTYDLTNHLMVEFEIVIALATSDLYCKNKFALMHE